jgi:hypothetical protein
MSAITMGIGTALSMLGVGAFFTSTHKHITTLIPLFLGLPLVILGIAGRKEDLKQGAELGAAGLSLVGVLVSLQGLFFPGLFPQTSGPRDEYPTRSAVQAITAVLCGTHLGLVLKSFRQPGQDV